MDAKPGVKEPKPVIHSLQAATGVMLLLVQVPPPPPLPNPTPLCCSHLTTLALSVTHGPEG